MLYDIDQTLVVLFDSLRCNALMIQAIELVNASVNSLMEVIRSVLNSSVK